LLQQTQAVGASVASDDVKVVGKGVAQRVTDQRVVIYYEKQGFFGQGLNVIFVKYFTQL
jgi:hypothetical protein